MGKKRPQSKVARIKRAHNFFNQVQTLAKDYGLLDDAYINKDDICNLSLKNDGIMIFIKMFYEPPKIKPKIVEETTVITKKIESHKHCDGQAEKK